MHHFEWHFRIDMNLYVYKVYSWILKQNNSENKGCFDDNGGACINYIQIAFEKETHYFGFIDDMWLTYTALLHTYVAFIKDKSW